MDDDKEPQNIGQEYFSEIADTIYVEPGEVFTIHSPSVPVVPPYFNVIPFIEISNDIEEVLEGQDNTDDGSRSRSYRLRADIDIKTAKLVLGVRDAVSDNVYDEMTRVISVVKNNKDE